MKSRNLLNTRKTLGFLLVTVLIMSNLSCEMSSKNKVPTERESNVELVILGNVQDAGSPQIGCVKACCKDYIADPNSPRHVVSLGLVDYLMNQKYVFEATPDISQQVNYLHSITNFSTVLPDGIFITHGHIGHYAGLMYLGKEATNARQVNTYLMPRMADFIRNDDPWKQLVLNQNIEVAEIDTSVLVSIGAKISVRAIQVPHRDEISETVAYIIEGPNRKALFLPDIDKWEKWHEDIIDLVNRVDYAFIDATFFNGQELGNRDMSTIPHPFVVESMEKFDQQDAKFKSKIHFIHFNHTNPLLNKSSKESQQVEDQGFKIARFGDKFYL